MLDEILAAKMSDKDLVSVVKTMFNACGTITEALRAELVTVADNQNSAFGANPIPNPIPNPFPNPIPNPVPNPVTSPILHPIPNSIPNQATCSSAWT